MDITTYLVECVKNKTPVSFSKYGDGEFNCASGHFGRNCDNDQYTPKKREALIYSFKYMVDEAQNSYIGIWHDLQNKTFWESIVTKPVCWSDYHSILFCKQNDEKKAELYRAIKNSDLNKIIICNELLIKSKSLLNAHHIICVPFNNWFDTQFDYYLNAIHNIIQDDGRQPLVITCCGMSAKIMICQLYKRHPNGIFLDFGSGLDKICTKRESRGWPYSYDYLIDLLKDILPDDWNSEKYNHIYEQATTKMGIHL
jgi:hypothetical protein